MGARGVALEVQADHWECQLPSVCSGQVPVVECTEIMLECPVCQSELATVVDDCPVCNWNLKPYWLSAGPDRDAQLAQQQSQLAWARDLWGKTQRQQAQLSQLQSQTLSADLMAWIQQAQEISLTDLYSTVAQVKAHLSEVQAELQQTQQEQLIYLDHMRMQIQAQLDELNKGQFQLQSLLAHQEVSEPPQPYSWRDQPFVEEPEEPVRQTRSLYQAQVISLPVHPAAAETEGVGADFLQDSEDESPKGELLDLSVDYRRLEALLAAEKWKEADQETANKMLQVARQTRRGWLDEADIKNFPCHAFHTIDQLWTSYSNGHFGLHIQRQLLEDVNCNYRDFGDRIGWRVKGWWLAHSHLTFGLNAPLGHLPAWGAWGRDGAWGGLEGVILASRLVECDL